MTDKEIQNLEIKANKIIERTHRRIILWTIFGIFLFILGMTGSLLYGLKQEWGMMAFLLLYSVIVVIVFVISYIYIIKNRQEFFNKLEDMKKGKK